MARTTITSPVVGTEEVRRRTIKPIKLWAIVGCAFLAVDAYSVTRWLLGGHAHPIDVGPDRVPTAMLVAIRVNEVIAVALIFVAFYFAIYRPWRRERRLGLDGTMYIVFATLWMWDPSFNYSRTFFTYNAASLNLGCPMCFLPGWQSNQNYAESITWDGAFYVGICWLFLKLGLRVAAWIRTRRPRIGTFGTILTVFTLSLTFDLLTEIVWLRAGVYAYHGAAGAPEWLTFFSGHYYQIPIWEVFAAAAWYTVIVGLWFFKNDKGQILAERGIEEIRCSGRRRTGLRLLACIGMFNLAVLLVYNAPMNYLSLQWNTWPADSQNRSYFTQGICGPLTTVACPDERLPIDHPGSAHVSPDGELIAPNGLPTPIRK